MKFLFGLMISGFCFAQAPSGDLEMVFENDGYNQYAGTSQEFYSGTLSKVLGMDSKTAKFVTGMVGDV